GVATPGHVDALRAAGGSILPIFAQQSIREMTRTNRTAEQVMGDALRGAAEGGYTAIQGADADHLKTPADVDRTAAAGFVFFTIDPSDHVDGNADSYSRDSELPRKIREVGAEAAWIAPYLDQSVPLSGGRSMKIDNLAQIRCAVKYGRA